MTVPIKRAADGLGMRVCLLVAVFARESLRIHRLGVPMWRPSRRDVLAVRFRPLPIWVSFAATLVTSASLAQAPIVPEPGARVLTVEEKALMDARLRAMRRQANTEYERVRGATGGVSVGARCAEGYVERQRIVPSVSDVEIVAATRTDCEGSRCRGLQVTALRAAGPFDLEVAITCSGG